MPSVREDFWAKSVNVVVLFPSPTAYMLASFVFSSFMWEYSLDLFNFPEFLEHQPVHSRTQPVHLQLAAGCSRPLHLECRWGWRAAALSQSSPYSSTTAHLSSTDTKLLSATNNQCTSQNIWQFSTLIISLFTAFELYPPTQGTGSEKLLSGFEFFITSSDPGVQFAATSVVG